MASIAGENHFGNQVGVVLSSFWSMHITANGPYLYGPTLGRNSKTLRLQPSKTQTTKPHIKQTLKKTSLKTKIPVVKRRQDCEICIADTSFQKPEGRGHLVLLPRTPKRKAEQDARGEKDEAESRAVRPIFSHLSTGRAAPVWQTDSIRECCTCFTHSMLWLPRFSHDVDVG